MALKIPIQIRDFVITSKRIFRLLEIRLFRIIFQTWLSLTFKVGLLFASSHLVERCSFWGEGVSKPGNESTPLRLLLTAL